MTDVMFMAGLQETIATIQARAKAASVAKQGLVIVDWLNLYKSEGDDLEIGWDFRNVESETVE